MAAWAAVALEADLPVEDLAEAAVLVAASAVEALEAVVLPGVGKITIITIVIIAIAITIAKQFGDYIHFLRYNAPLVASLSRPLLRELEI